MREPQAAVMGWQCLRASCNRAISKKLKVMKALALWSCSERTKATRKKIKENEGCAGPQDVHWAGQPFIPDPTFLVVMAAATATHSVIAAMRRRTRWAFGRFVFRHEHDAT